MKFDLFPKLPIELVKIKGDAGIYKVWALDWYHFNVCVMRAGELEWVKFAKVQKIITNPF